MSNNSTMMSSFPCGGDSMAEPFVYLIGLSTELWQCEGCNRRLRRTMRSYFDPDLCLSCAIGRRRW
jgi:hypothetical protein